MPAGNYFLITTVGRGEEGCRMDREQRGRKKGEERRLRWDKGSTSTGRWNSRLRESSAGQLTAQAKDLFRLAACEQQKASHHVLLVNTWLPGILLLTANNSLLCFDIAALTNNGPTGRECPTHGRDIGL